MSHHGNEGFNSSSDLFKKLMEDIPMKNNSLEEFQKKLQGEFPDGRLNVADEGALALQIGCADGKVIIEFAQATKWVGFTPQQAVDIAQLLIKHARNSGVMVSLKF